MAPVPEIWPPRTNNLYTARWGRKFYKNCKGLTLWKLGKISGDFEKNKGKSSLTYVHIRGRILRNFEQITMTLIKILCKVNNFYVLYRITAWRNYGINTGIMTITIVHKTNVKVLDWLRQLCHDSESKFETMWTFNYISVNYISYNSY